MANNSLYITRIFSESMALLIEARNYSAYSEEYLSVTRLGDQTSLRVICEAMRVTSYLANIMAWLFAQKAIEAGEITLAQAVDRGLSMSCADFWTSTPWQHEEMLPKGLRGLLQRSHRLYNRTLRIDTKMRETLAITEDSRV